MKHMSCFCLECSCDILLTIVLFPEKANPEPVQDPKQLASYSSDYSRT